MGHPSRDWGLVTRRRVLVELTVQGVGIVTVVKGGS